MGNNEPLVSRRLSLQMAKSIMAAAEAKAVELGRSMAIAIVDPQGLLLHFSRMDGAALMAADIALSKAYSAVGFGAPTHRLYEVMAADPSLSMSIASTPRLTVIGGGFPALSAGELLGGIGVSGGHYTEDMAVAEAALQALALD